MLLLRYAIWKVTPVFTTSKTPEECSCEINHMNSSISAHDLTQHQTRIQTVGHSVFDFGLWVSVRALPSIFSFRICSSEFRGAQSVTRALILLSPVSTGINTEQDVSRMLSLLWQTLSALEPALEIKTWQEAVISFLTKTKSTNKMNLVQIPG